MIANRRNEAMSVGDDDIRFGFGANWSDYVDTQFSNERVEISKEHILNFLKLEDLRGKIFLDVGCGSGLHSLAAWRAGALQVVSFDYDSKSVATTARLRELSGCPENWQVRQGSILDVDFLRTLPKADIVYSWGVLHHTGKMWEAIKNAALRLSDKGVFYIALYSKDAYVSPPHQYWLSVKREYNLSGPAKKKWMEWRYALNDVGRGLLRGRNPISYVRNYKKSRGMSYWHDIKDWLGGYPMEFAGNKEVECFAKEQLGLELISIKAGEGNTEFLFRQSGIENYWDQVASKVGLLALPGPYRHLYGKAWSAPLPLDSVTLPEKLMLYENSSPVGWPNASRRSIAKWGSGRYRVDREDLIFSTTDNSDPNLSGNVYAVRDGFCT